MLAGGIAAGCLAALVAAYIAVQSLAGGGTTGDGSNAVAQAADPDDGPVDGTGAESAADDDGPATPDEEPSATRTSVPAAAVGDEPIKVLFVVDYRGFWNPDYEGVVAAMEANGVNYQIGSSQLGEARSSSGETVRVDARLGEIPAALPDALLFCGRSTGSQSEFIEDATARSAAQTLIERMLAEGRVVGAICGGPAILASAGVLGGRRATCHSDQVPFLTHRGAIVQNTSVVPDSQIVTARDPAAAVDFVNTVIQAVRETRATRAGRE
jgi:putative intracellular protease/amidase